MKLREFIEQEIRDERISCIEDELAREVTENN